MGCLKSLIGLVLIAVVAVVLYLNKDRITQKWHGLREGDKVEVFPSRALADSAAVKIDDLGKGRRTRIALTQLELQSLLQYKYKELLPAFVDSPTIELKGNKIAVKGSVPVDRLPSVGELGEAASFLPDTTEVAVTGELLPLRTGRVALTVDEVKAARIPLPHRLIPKALARLGRKDEPGLPSDAMSVKLPPGADAAYVHGDSLIFLTNTKR